MKKMVLISISTVLLLGVSFVIFKGSQLTDITIKKSVTINSPVSKVYEMVSNLNNFHKWSPFLHKDPKLVYKVEQNPQILGSVLNWSGGKDGKDLGSMEIINAEFSKHIIYQCDIKQPYPSLSSFQYSFSETGTTTVVNQEFKMKSSLINAIFMWIFGAKGEIDSNNQLGLELLKKASE